MLQKVPRTVLEIVKLSSSQVVIKGLKSHDFLALISENPCVYNGERKIKRKLLAFSSFFTNFAAEKK